MSKRLYIVRHAIALSVSGVSDRDRDLAPQGIEDAKALGKTMVKKGYKPATALCSDALRTSRTYELIAESYDCLPCAFLDSLYNASADDIMGEICSLDNSLESALVVAHNPGVHELVYNLADPDDVHLNHIMGGYKPATLSILDCPVESWGDIEPRKNTLIDVMDTLDYNAPARPTRWM